MARLQSRESAPMLCECVFPGQFELSGLGVNAQPLSTPLTCLGDGHDGIWNLYGTIGNPTQRREILDWYHLVENLGKVGGSKQRLYAAEARLWQGDVKGAIAQFNDWHPERVTTFMAYLNKH